MMKLAQRFDQGFFSCLVRKLREGAVHLFLGNALIKMLVLGEHHLGEKISVIEGKRSADQVGALGMNVAQMPLRYGILVFKVSIKCASRYACADAYIVDGDFIKARLFEKSRKRFDCGKFEFDVCVNLKIAYHALLSRVCVGVSLRAIPRLLSLYPYTPSLWACRTNSVSVLGALAQVDAPFSCR